MHGTHFNFYSQPEINLSKSVGNHFKFIVLLIAYFAVNAKRWRKKCRFVHNIPILLAIICSKVQFGNSMNICIATKMASIHRCSHLNGHTGSTCWNCSRFCASYLFIIVFICIYIYMCVVRTVLVSWPGHTTPYSLKRKIQISAQSSCHRTEMPHWLAYSYNWLINLVSFHANFPISLLILRCHRYVVHFNFCAKPNESKVWKELSSQCEKGTASTAKETSERANNKK